MSEFKMDIPWDRIIEKILSKLTGIIAEAWGDAIANRYYQNIKVEIAFGEFDTVGGKKQTDLLAWGDYFRSIGVSDGKIKNDNNYEVSIYSSDPKAEDIEWGTKPQEEAGTTDEEIINWARQKKIPNPESFGRNLAKIIRSKGQPEHPVFRRSEAKTESQRSEVVSDGIKLLRKKKKDFTI